MVCKEAVLLHTDAQFEYYKVPVSPGLSLLAETVVQTCEAAGMRATCPGSSTCQYTDESRFAVISTYHYFKAYSMILAGFRGNPLKIRILRSCSENLVQLR